VSGDFFQLPPVDLRTKGFAFEAEYWNSSFDLLIELSEVFRQSDPRVIKLLQGMRKGECDSDDIRCLEEHCTDAESDSSIVTIYPRREDVDKTNREHFTNLNGKRMTYKAFDYGSFKYSGIISSDVELCVGARVMLNKNINVWRKLVNGATGIITGFSVPSKKCRHKLVPVVKFDSGEVVVIHPAEWDVFDGDKKATREQIPLILAWALSIHKCQGMSLDRVHTDLTRAFDYGMVYVALSRVKTLEGLHLSGFDPSKIKVHPKVVKFYESLHRAAYLAKVLNAHAQVR
jgi:ATP-dependent DNA helicase PIF1